MAAGSIITVLANIPWGQVVENAPKVANGAMKLWNAVRNRKRPTAEEGESPVAAAGAGQSEADVLRARLLQLEDSVASLQEQMQESSELIKALAEQNTQLVARIEANRRRLVWVAAACVIAAILAAVSLAMALAG